MSDVPESFIGWMDYSEHERRKMLDVIDLFAEQDTRDEMGIGTVRDAFADLLFPGMSTIQTRARYFLFVPWIYLEIERRRVSSHDVAAKADAKKSPSLTCWLTQMTPPGRSVFGRELRSRGCRATSIGRGLGRGESGCFLGHRTSIIV